MEKYIVEKKDRYNPDWIKACEVPGDCLEAKVTDLKERGEYQFRIVAVNKAGPSPRMAHIFSFFLFLSYAH